MSALAKISTPASVNSKFGRRAFGLDLHLPGETAFWMLFRKHLEGTTREQLRIYPEAHGGESLGLLNLNEKVVENLEEVRSLPESSTRELWPRAGGSVTYVTTRALSPPIWPLLPAGGGSAPAALSSHRIGATFAYFDGRSGVN
ncbi:hypothetical protein DdX_18936 [Ditylenchus destructor]|uniref:Uncharacterized protein n=1 Tax=Ditylenchus destructor TaxID=166010 RepID=A0AAD4QSJ6_9BILA|nr:hypothetical protein DdX_18936 [Ditylenchus destructor]